MEAKQEGRNSNDGNEMKGKMTKDTDRVEENSNDGKETPVNFRCSRYVYVAISVGVVISLVSVIVPVALTVSGMYYITIFTSQNSKF